MKAAPFAYHRPDTVDEAVEVLATGDAKVLAGGQSLVPVLAMRLGRPGTLVDINRLPGLDTLVVSGGELHLGAAVRQRRVERSPEVRGVPLIARAMPFVGHRELRSRGTVCGSLAHADPAAELPAVAACLRATVVVRGPDGERTVDARDFVTGAMTTAVGADELVTGVRFPLSREGEGFGFAEIARRHGDFALAGVAVRVRRDGEAVLAAFGVSDRPVVRDVTALLDDPTEAALRPATDALAAEVVDTDGDAHGSRGYRARLLGVLAARELARARREAHA
ncbi:FAD binding domain-containing protein [Actinomycetospora cinnamomea]|uniref:Carbon-monoxide dehydrogenase medium subunit n=1 Tax=Actinomycetospora cinnamomea TaxID=663609 RepID=A0A2U1FR60_9PSEU|nr:FAD binding domain-containing protein [Actinomycetospora cinnamomea]PVZ14639.1 carbon-monoxide dehydrogenase medium subunit [Actinomycetospora cinnamomea]